MADRKNLKVTPVTHEYIVNEQRPGETIDDTLQRLLGIGSDPAATDQTMVAYLPKNLRAQAEEMIAHIEDLGSFDREYETDIGPGDTDGIRFIDTSTGITIVRLKVSERGYGVEYRDASGEMQLTDHGFIYSNHDVDLSEVKEAATEKIEGARRRWGE